MDKLFDGSDAHLLPGNAELIRRLREYHDSDLEYGGFGVQEAVDAAYALEAADKRIAELEQTNCSRLDEAERKLAMVLEAIQQTIAENGHLADGEVCTLKSLKEALAQIGGDE